MSAALVVFTSCQNSYPFQERHVYLRGPVKIGRTVARFCPAKNNAIFDCKVLSRNHALLWFDHKSDKFFLQDTGSSNGTFINSRRLSPAGQGSPPSQIFTGDIIQFGVDVTESNDNVTHGCVVSSVLLVQPDGVEASRCSENDPAAHGSLVTSSLPLEKVAAHTPGVCSLELFQLSQYLKEALQREQMLEQKLVTLQWLLGRTLEASEATCQSWSEDDMPELVSQEQDTHTYATAATQEQDTHTYEPAATQQQDTHTYATAATQQQDTHTYEPAGVRSQLSLSSAQDSCVQLRHLADKYNTAAKLIKDLTHTIKLAERQQEEQRQEHQQELEELHLLIQGFQEPKQEPQNNSDTEQHLKSLQGCGMDAAVWAESGRLGWGEVRCLRSTGRMEEKKDPDAEESGKLQAREAELQSREAELQSREAELQSREAELQSREAHLSAQLREAQAQATSSRSRCVELQDVLEKERAEAQRHSQESAKQIQALQAQAQKLQEEVRMLSAERDCIVSSAQEEALLLRGAVEASVSEREKERAALQASLAAVTAELDRGRRSAAQSEQETASLKARLQEVVQQSAQAAQLQGELQKNCTVLQSDCAALRSEKAALQENMQRVEKELFSSRDQAALLGRSVSVLERTQGELESQLAQQQEQHQLDCVRLKAQLDQATLRIKSLQREYEDTQAELVQVKQRGSQVEQEKLSLSQELQQCKDNLRQLQERASRYEDTQVELVQVKQRGSEVEQEKLSLSQELQQCKDNLRQLQERASRPSLQSVLPVVVGVALAVLYWGYSSLW